MFTLIALAFGLAAGYIAGKYFPNVLDKAQADAIKVQSAINAEVHILNRTSAISPAPIIVDAARGVK